MPPFVWLNRASSLTVDHDAFHVKFNKTDIRKWLKTPSALPESTTGSTPSNSGPPSKVSKVRSAMFLTLLHSKLAWLILATSTTVLPQLACTVVEQHLELGKMGLSINKSSPFQYYGLCHTYTCRP